MGSIKLFLLLSSLSFFIQPSKSEGRCQTEYCGFQVPIRFPFQLMASFPQSRCGYPGFTVTCKNETKKILTFPFSGEFEIQGIDYFSQLVRISDPYGCTAGRLLQGFNYSGTPFQPPSTQILTFLNCTPDSKMFIISGIMPISCLSSENYSVVGVSIDESSDFSKRFVCSEITTILYPAWDDALSELVANYISLIWKEPDCQWCENNGGTCRFKNDITLDLECRIDFHPDFKRDAKYAALFVAVSGMCIIGLIICIRRKIKHQTQSNNEVSTLTNYVPHRVVVAKGLDSLAIEKYPTTVVGI
ncbi:hypothetical protein CCACVL1_13446 [Corchorus capsularis]|uniref:RING-type E3 ubiquitin transferase n=1 Tax=Corchorus capsularis TaxID=210143 RepID=A0A1R3IB72_COCAP|nr:hypothetical protein CCACVL1_13446 [Corchorus capsularis]